MFDAAGNFVAISDLRMDIAVDRTLDTFTGTVEVVNMDRAGTVTQSRPGTLRATRLNVKRPAL